MLMLLREELSSQNKKENTKKYTSTSGNDLPYIHPSLRSLVDILLDIRLDLHKNTLVSGYQIMYKFFLL